MRICELHYKVLTLFLTLSPPQHPVQLGIYIYVCIYIHTYTHSASIPQTTPRAVIDYDGPDHSDHSGRQNFTWNNLEEDLQ